MAGRGDHADRRGPPGTLILRDGSGFEWHVISGYLWFFVFAFWVHDLPSVRQQGLVVLGALAIDAVLLGLFGGVLGWI